MYHYTQCTGCLLEGVMHDLAEVHHCIHNDRITGFIRLVTAGGGEGGEESRTDWCVHSSIAGSAHNLIQINPWSSPNGGKHGMRSGNEV